MRNVEIRAQFSTEDRSGVSVVDIKLETGSSQATRGSVASSGRNETRKLVLNGTGFANCELRTRNFEVTTQQDFCITPVRLQDSQAAVAFPNCFALICGPPNCMAQVRLITVNPIVEKKIESARKTLIT